MRAAPLLIMYKERHNAGTGLQLSPRIINFPTINILVRTLIFYMTHYRPPPRPPETCPAPQLSRAGTRSRERYERARARGRVLFC